MKGRYDDKDLDKIIGPSGYRALYSARVKGARMSGDNLLGHCPFHDDRQESFSANIKNGLWKCFAGCGGGNVLTFWSMMYGVDQKESYKQLLQMYGAWDEPGEDMEPARTPAPAPAPTPARASGKAKGPAPYTLEQYAEDKKLPADFLVGHGVSTAKDAYKGGGAYLKIPYFTEGDDGRNTVYRKRYGGKEFRWGKGAAGRIPLYGDWMLPAMKKGGKVILVEGESDSQTLWFLRYPALGVAGASNFKPEHARRLAGMTIYIHVEPDKGGQAFLEKTGRALSEAGHDAPVFRWACSAYGEKDPSALYLARGKEEAAALIGTALARAERVDVDAIAIAPAIQGAPLNLRQPDMYEYGQDGIFFFNKKGERELLCRTPVIMVRRIINASEQIEKAELAFFRDGAWHTAILPRGTVFTSRGITELSGMGVMVTSENARGMVRYLSALEAANLDIIGKTESVSSMGWTPKGGFLPGLAGGMVLDVDPSMRAWADGYRTAGTLEAWKAGMAGNRDNYKFRFILAAAFAAPLLRIIRQRLFTVYNWGGSKSGKTAALKAAISVFGDPDALLTSFNATQVAIERVASFYKDLPIGIDERQLAGSKQEALEKIIYMLSSGKGRARGSRDGGLQEFATWTTIALATGEEPISGDTTQTGVSTRTIEVYGGPFEGQQGAASDVYQVVADNYGHAGPAFISQVARMGKERIRQEYKAILEAVRTSAGDCDLSHATSAAAVALADAMADSWIFSDGIQLGADGVPAISQASKVNAVRMAARILRDQEADSAGDVNENAAQFVADWIMANHGQFGDMVVGQRYGVFEGGSFFVFSSILKKALKDAGYNSRKTLRYLAEKGIITTSEDADGKTQLSVVRKVDSKACRMVQVNLADMPEEIPKDESFTPLGDRRAPFDGQMSLF